jgi:amino acid permease
MKRNVPIVGFIIGAILPLLGFFIVYLIFKSTGQSLSSFINSYWVNNKTFAKLITLSILINLLPFVYFNSKRMDYASRGVFVSTMLYVVFVLLLMFVW